MTRILGVSAVPGTFPPGPVDWSNGQTLVPAEELEQAQARIAELERRPAYNFGGYLAGLSVLKAEREAQLARNACSTVDEILERQDGESSHNAARRLRADRDHWKAEAERADLALAALADNVARADLESEATADDVEYPETLAVAQRICESLPSEDPGGVGKPWDELAEEERAPFVMNARNLGHVFPEQYPKLAAELARYRAGVTADDVVEKVQAELALSGIVVGGDQGDTYMRVAIEKALAAAGLLRGES